MAAATATATAACRIGYHDERTRARPWRTRASRSTRVARRKPGSPSARAEPAALIAASPAARSTDSQARVLPQAARDGSPWLGSVGGHALTRDDDLLACRDGAAVAVDDELDVGGRRALDDRERDRAELVVTGDARDLPDDPTRLAARRELTELPHLRARLGRQVARAVEVQHDDASGRSAEVVHARDRLLAAVAALVQVHGRAQPVELVRDRAVVDLAAGAGAPCLDPGSLARPGPDERPAGGLARGDGLDEVRARDEHEPPSAVGTGVVRVVGSVARATGRGVRPRVAPGHRFALGTLGVDGLADRSPVGRDVCDLDAQHEAHPVEPRRELRRCRTLGEQPGRLAVVHHAGRMLDVALRAEHEELGRGPRCERRDLLRGDRVQPGEPVRTGDAHDTEVRLVDDGDGARERTLLGGRVAVVEGDPGVDARPGDGAVPREQRAEGRRHDCASSSVAVPSARTRRADAHVCIGCPNAARSKAHIRSPWTSPYKRLPAVTSAPDEVRATRSLTRSTRPLPAVPRYSERCPDGSASRTSTGTWSSAIPPGR